MPKLKADLQAVLLGRALKERTEIRGVCLAGDNFVVIAAKSRASSQLRPVSICIDYKYL
jgi:20S proteasome alpha/beta subunit